MARGVHQRSEDGVSVRGSVAVVVFGVSKGGRFRTAVHCRLDVQRSDSSELLRLTSAAGTLECRSDASP